MNLNTLPQLPQDAANHFIYGAVGYLAAAVFTRATGLPWWLPLAATVVVAVAKKLYDYTPGFNEPHPAVDWADIKRDIGAQVGAGVICLIVGAVGL